MDEQQWRECADPEKMLTVLNDRDASARKFRLFSSVCARRVWAVMSGDDPHSVVMAAERLADGLLSEQDRHERLKKFRAVFPRRMTPDYPVPPSYLADMVAYYTLWSNTVSHGHLLHLNWHGASSVSHWVQFIVFFQETKRWEPWPRSSHPLRLAEAEFQCQLIRDIFGTFIGRVPLEISWLTWRDGLIRRLAENAYERRQLPSGHLDNGRLAVLADALEEAGCDDPDLLGHLRGAGPHFRGCHLLDALLAKE